MTYDSGNLRNHLFDDFHILLVLVVSQVHVDGLERVVLRGQGGSTERRGKVPDVGTLIGSGRRDSGGDGHDGKVNEDGVGSRNRGRRGTMTDNEWKDKEEEEEERKREE